jgi:hypothetical protein
MLLRMNKSHEWNGAVIGMVLGDSSLSGYEGRNARTGILRTRHAVRQKDYLLWKRDILSEKVADVRVRFVGNNGFGAFETTTGAVSKLFFLWRTLYKNGRKSLTEAVLNRLTPLGLAIWYMDDGSLVLGKDKKGCINRRNIYWALHCFSQREAEMFRDWLRTRYGVEGHVTLERGMPRLRLNTTDTKKLLEVMEPYIRQVPCMGYKAELKYVYQTAHRENYPARE